MALAKIKCIPIVIHLSYVPRSGYITARDQSMLESGVTEGGKNTAKPRHWLPVFFLANEVR